MTFTSSNLYFITCKSADSCCAHYLEFIKEVALPWKEQRRFFPRLNTFAIIYFQKAATDALQSMTEVLKIESSAGRNYEALLDGARSLASGLGSVLRVASYSSTVYAISDSDEDSSNLYRRRRSFGQSILSFVGLKTLERPKREAAKDRLETKKKVK